MKDDEFKSYDEFYYYCLSLGWSKEKADKVFGEIIEFNIPLNTRSIRRLTGPKSQSPLATRDAAQSRRKKCLKMEAQLNPYLFIGSHSAIASIGPQELLCDGKDEA